MVIVKVENSSEQKRVDLENYSKTISNDELIPNFKDLKTNVVLKKLSENLKKNKKFKGSRYFLDMSDIIKKL